MASTPAAKARTELNVAIGYVDRAARRLAIAAFIVSFAKLTFTRSR